MPALDDITQFLGRLVVYGGLSVGLFWLIAQKAAERWIDSHFAKRQKEFEHEQAKELQRIKARLDTVIHASLKLQEREFKLIPEAWEKVSEAFGLANWLCSPMQSYTTLARMSDMQLQEFLSKQELLWATQKQQILETPARDRDEVWQEIDNRMRYGRAYKALAEADKFLKTNSIFLPDELRDQFSKLVTIIWGALVSFEVGSHLGAKDYKMIREGWDKLQNDGDPLHKRIEDAVRKRLVEQARLAEDQFDG